MTSFGYQMELSSLLSGIESEQPVERDSQDQDLTKHRVFHWGRGRRWISQIIRGDIFQRLKLASKRTSAKETLVSREKLRKDPHACRPACLLVRRQWSRQLTGCINTTQTSMEARCFDSPAFPGSESSQIHKSSMTSTSD